jgi:hypothetical protein
MGTKVLSMWRKLYNHANEVFSLLRGRGGGGGGGYWSFGITSFFFHRRTLFPHIPK